MSAEKKTQAVQIGKEQPVYKRRWIAVVALGLSLFLSALDATILALALPPIATHFQLSDSSVAAVLLAYSIPITLLILPSGSILNRFRSLPIFLASILGFGLGSIICGLAPSFPVLLAGRVIQGGFAALIGTQGFALATSIVSEKERGRAMGIMGTIAPLGGVVGPGLGGLLLANFGWSSIFFVNIPVIAVASLLGLVSLKGISLASRRSVKVYSQLLELLRKPKFTFSLFAFFASVSASVALYYLLPFDLQGIQKMPQSLSGVIFLCVPLGMMVMGMLGGYLTDRLGARPFVITGSLLLLGGVLLLSPVISSKTTGFDIVWRLLLIGGGIGLFSSPIQTQIMSTGEREMLGAASVLSNLSARLASVFSPLVIGIVWSVLGSFNAQLASAMLIVVILCLVSFLFAILSVRRKTDVQKHGVSLGSG